RGGDRDDDQAQGCLRGRRRRAARGRDRAGVRRHARALGRLADRRQPALDGRVADRARGSRSRARRQAHRPDAARRVRDRGARARRGVLLDGVADAALAARGDDRARLGAGRRTRPAPPSAQAADDTVTRPAGESRAGLSPLPALVARYVERALEGAAESRPARVRLVQAGEMQLRPGGRALRFTAVEELAVERVAFEWRARFPLAPLVALTVVDRYAEGEGELRGRLLGVPVLGQRGPEISVGEALRYLAELPWAPHAMRGNRELEWRELDEHAVEVATGVRGERVAVRLDFDDAGDVVRASCAARPRPVGK